MKKTDKLNSLIPLHLLEQEAQTQIFDILKLDECLKLAVMPDAHAGYDLCIGGVALMDGVVSPSFVGVDIGCGMCHVNTGMKASDLFPDERSKQEAYSTILAKIPVGFTSHQKNQDYAMFDSASGDKALEKDVIAKLYKQLGTLGGGNHFIEIGVNGKDEVGVTIHSGSRGAGKIIADFYTKQGRLLGLGSDIGRAYLADMNFALEYALANRRTMIERILESIGIPFQVRQRLIKEIVNENHNHAIITSSGVLHRKGATPAEEGQIGIIPANMRDGVFITRGLGNRDYLESASHGAGRKMSRGQAKRSLDLDDFKAQMDGIVGRTDEAVLDESPGAYKNIHDVIGFQEGVVINVTDHFRPIINVKG